MTPRRLRAPLVCLVLILAVGCTAQAPAPPAPPAPRTPQAADFREVVKRAKDRVFPAVVFIKCIKESYESGKKISQEISGSGVITSADGELLTNWHVVDKAIEIRCLLLDGRTFEAKALGTDKDTDLAVLKMKLPAGATVPYASLGDSSRLKEGDFVMAMGAPWGLSRTVSIGIVSCARRFLPDHSEYSLWIQTDAAISPGNSGGPLVNTNGEIVGINTRGVLVGGDMGFAIPGETVKLFVPQIREHGKVDWSWTGLQLQPLRDFNRNIYFEGTQGVIVAGTDRESPARLAGILPRDRILRVNGKELDALTEENLPAVRLALGRLPKNAPAEFVLLRAGESVTVSITPREKGKVEGEEFDCPRWDLTVKTVNQFDNPDLYFFRNEGVFIFGIKHPGNASESGLHTDDIIIAIDGREVTTLEDVRRIHEESLQNLEEKHRILFTVLRNGLRRQVVLDYYRDYEKD